MAFHVFDVRRNVEVYLQILRVLCLCEAIHVLIFKMGASRGMSLDIVLQILSFLSVVCVLFAK